MPITVLEGLLAGFQHPAVGLDHLTFMIVIGIAAALVPAGTAVIASFVVTSLVGALIHGVNFDFRYSEHAVATSVMMAGILLLIGYGGKRAAWLPFAIVAGLIHGYAFGATILGADWPVIGAYLIGILGTITAIPVAVMPLASKALRLPNACSPLLRAAGGVIVCLGIYFLISVLRAVRIRFTLGSGRPVRF
jgi:urease accessory protein